MERFILSRELGRLAKWLRILGFDAQYFTEEKISSLLILALRDNRIILTRNRRMPEIYPGKILYIKGERIKEQIIQVIEDLKLKLDTNLMFSRCIICNTQLNEIKKEEVKNKVPDYVFKTQDSFVTCLRCQRIYWQGTHWGNVTKTLKEII